MYHRHKNNIIIFTFYRHKYSYSLKFEKTPIHFHKQFYIHFCETENYRPINFIETNIQYV
jgi:hypothetical protein